MSLLKKWVPPYTVAKGVIKAVHIRKQYTKGEIDKKEYVEKGLKNVAETGIDLSPLGKFYSGYKLVKKVVGMRNQGDKFAN